MSANTHLMGFQRGKAADKMEGEKKSATAPKAAAPATKPGNPEEKSDSSKSELHGPDENGGYKTKGPGGNMDHPHIGHAMAHLAATHHPSGHHMHIHHDGGGSSTSHHAGEDGQVQGPDEHGSTQDLQDHVGQVMGDGDSQGMDQGEAAPMHDGGGLSGLGF